MEQRFNMAKPTLTELQNDPDVQRALATMNEDNVGGRPCIDLDESAYEDPIDSDYDIDCLMNDLILAEFVDEEEGNVLRDGIFIPKNVSTTKAWRTARVIKVGPTVPKSIKEGCYIRFPSDRGLITIAGKKKRVFLNADRIFCTLRKRGK